MAQFALAALAAAMWAVPAHADPDCTCRAQGREFALGAAVCLASPKGPRIATCGMVLNNTSWQFTDTPCVISAAPAEPERETTVARAQRDGG